MNDERYNYTASTLTSSTPEKMYTVEGIKAAMKELKEKTKDIVHLQLFDFASWSKVKKAIDKEQDICAPNSIAKSVLGIPYVVLNTADDVIQEAFRI